MKTDNTAWLLTSYLFLSLIILSCGLFKQNTTPRKPFSEVRYENNYFEIFVDSFKSKKQTHKQLRGLLKDSSGQVVSRYNISDVCGCISKYIVNVKKKYKLVTQFDIIPLSPEDKFVLNEFSNLPQINDYCSKSLLDPAKGFILMPKK